MVPPLGEGGTQQRDRTYSVTNLKKYQGWQAFNMESREYLFTFVSQSQSCMFGVSNTMLESWL